MCYRSNKGLGFLEHQHCLIVISNFLAKFLIGIYQEVECKFHMDFFFKKLKTDFKERSCIEVGWKAAWGHVLLSQ